MPQRQRRIQEPRFYRLMVKKPLPAEKPFKAAPYKPTLYKVPNAPKAARKLPPVQGAEDDED